MDKDIVDNWEKNKHKVKQKFKNNLPSNYEGIIKVLARYVICREDVTLIKVENRCMYFLIHSIHHDKVIYLTYVGYGSCAECALFDDAMRQENKDNIVEDLMLVALHIVQNTKQVNISFE